MINSECGFWNEGETVAESYSFKTDIGPVLAAYRDQMHWRFDLTDYAAVAASAKLIYARISSTEDGLMMPPAGNGRSPSGFIPRFKACMDGGCQP